MPLHPGCRLFKSFNLPLFCILIFPVLMLRADPAGVQVLLKNGDRLSGIVVEESPTGISLQSSILGLINIDREIIVSINSDVAAGEGGSDPLPVSTAGAKNPQSAKETGESSVPELLGVNATASQGKAIPVFKVEPSSSGENKNPDNSESAGLFDYLAELMAIDFLEEWKSKVNISLQWHDTQRDKSDFRLRFDTSKKVDLSEMRFDFNYDYGSQEDNGDGNKKSSDRFTGGLRLRRNWKEQPFFFQSNSRYRKDLIKNIDDEFEQSLGLGWRFLDGKRLRASVTPSAKGKFQKMEGVPEAWNFLSSFKNDFHYKLNDKLTLVQESDFSMDPLETENYTIDAMFRLEAKLTKTLNTDLRWELDYDNKIANRIDKTQERVILSMGYIF